MIKINIMKTFKTLIFLSVYTMRCLLWIFLFFVVAFKCTLVLDVLVGIIIYLISITTSVFYVDYVHVQYLCLAVFLFECFLMRIEKCWLVLSLSISTFAGRAMIFFNIFSSLCFLYIFWGPYTVLKAVMYAGNFRRRNELPLQYSITV